MQIDDEYFASKEFKDILTSYEESVKSGHPVFMDVDDLADIADYYNYTGEREKACAVIDFALEISPGATIPLVFKAREALDMGDVEQATAYAEYITDKDDPDYRYLKAEILIAQDKIDESESYLSDYFQTVDPAEHEDFVLDVAGLYLDYGVNDKAYEWMAHVKNSKRDDYKELMARTLFGMGEFAKSAGIFNELIDRHPYSKHYWNALASAQFMSEDFSGSVASSEYAIAIDPEDPDGLLAKANGLYRLENYTEALKYYERYCRMVPDDEFGFLNAGTCLVCLGCCSEAVDTLRMAEETADPDSPYLAQIYQELAFAYSRMKMPEKAIECIDQTEDLDCDHIDMDVLRGHILLENDMPEEADKRFQEAIADSESSPDILLRIMVSLYDNNYLDMAYTMFKKFLELMDDDFNEGYSYMALCCWDLRRLDEFLHYLEIAVKCNPKEAKLVLGYLFPKDLDPREYYNYMFKELNDKDK